MSMQAIDMEYKPWGGLAGVYHGIQANQIDQSNEQMLARQGFENQVKQKDAMVAQEQMSNPEWLKSEMAGQMGKNASLEAAGKYDQGTLESRMKETITSNAAKMTKAQAEQEVSQSQMALQALSKISAIGEQTGYDGLQFVNAAGSIAKEMGVDPKILQQFAAAPPEARKKMIDGFASAHKAIVTYVPSVMQHVAQKAPELASNEKTNAATNAAHIQVGAGNNIATVRAAQIAADSRMAVAKLKQKADDIISQAQAGKLSYEKAAVALEMMSHVAEDPAQATHYSKLASAFSVADQKSKAAGKQVPVDLGAMGVQTQQISPTLGSQSSGSLPTTNQDLKSKVEAHGYIYQPEKFDYRVLPNGDVQRKKK